MSYGIFNNQEEIEILWAANKIKEELATGWAPHLRKDLGLQLCRVQRGLLPNTFRPMPQIGANVREIAVSTTHVCYLAKLTDCIHILHISRARPINQPSLQDIAAAKQCLTKSLKLTKSKGSQLRSKGNNAFSNLAFSDAEAAGLKIKALLFITLQEILNGAVLTQNDIAERLGADQPKISKIKNGKFGDFSIERIAEYLNLMQYDIQIRVSTSNLKAEKGTITLVRGRDDAVTAEAVVLIE